MSIWYGDNVADDSELRLCGDIVGKRVLELGIASTSNAITMAAAGAKAIAIDPSADKIARLRAAAEAAEVKVECHHGELADLGLVSSGSIDLVVAAHSLANVDDLPRLLRQVHRVLKSDAARSSWRCTTRSRRCSTAATPRRAGLRSRRHHVQRAVHGLRANQLPPRRDATS